MSVLCGSHEYSLSDGLITYSACASFVAIVINSALNITCINQPHTEVLCEIPPSGVTAPSCTEGGK